MTRLPTLLRTSPALWLAPVVAAMAVAYASIYEPATRDGYRLALTAAASVTLDFVAPICAALAAWEAGRLRRAGWWELPHVRSHTLVAVRAVLPIVIVGWIATSLAIVAYLAPTGVLLPDWRIVAVVSLTVVAHAAVGFAIGLWLPAVAAAPSALILGWVWMALPRSLEPLWLRHLNGDLSSCCVVSAELAPVALIGAGAVSVGLIGTGLILSAPRLRLSRIIGAAALMSGAVTVGVFSVDELGPDPTVARSPEHLVCEPGPPQTCVWPEHAHRLAEVTALASQADAAWRAVGLRAAGAYSEANGFGLSNESDDSDILYSLAYAMLPEWPECALDGESYPGGQAIDYVHAWLASVAGLDDTELRRRFGVEPGPGQPAILSVVNELRRMPASDQLRWFEINQEALRSCDRRARLDPAA